MRFTLDTAPPDLAVDAKARRILASMVGDYSMSLARDVYGSVRLAWMRPARSDDPPASVVDIPAPSDGSERAGCVDVEDPRVIYLNAQATGWRDSARLARALAHELGHVFVLARERHPAFAQWRGRVTDHEQAADAAAWHLTHTVTHAYA